ncbi:hypothetical protein AVEN_254287-1 [Araneus ventricosus]|uniref:Uncharacterized protein n=1 Tax=Araneus ventricosus TaxID=182803 RepID=A0A4Y2FCH6_ARAVE|nr:hypothetical protein AVEN_254287-1 [Araneus ventricosus]
MPFRETQKKPFLPPFHLIFCDDSYRTFPFAFEEATHSSKQSSLPERSCNLSRFDECAERVAVDVLGYSCKFRVSLGSPKIGSSSSKNECGFISSLEICVNVCY